MRSQMLVRPSKIFVWGALILVNNSIVTNGGSLQNAPELRASGIQMILEINYETNRPIIVTFRSRVFWVNICKMAYKKHTHEMAAMRCFRV